MMSFKVVLFLVNIQVIFGQNEILDCAYTQPDYRGYSCKLNIFNPNGLNNFQSISGVHLTGKTNDDVEYVETSFGSKTSNIPSVICDTFKNIKTISMYNNGVVKIEENSLNNCKNINSFTCYTNNFTTVPETAFFDNPELTYLALLRNLISSLPENVFMNQHKLETLYLQTNKLTDLPRNIFRPLRNLKELDISYNYMPNLRHEWFETLENLVELYVGGNQIEVLPNNIFSPLKNIFTIHLQNNRLTVINSKSFGTLPTIRQIIFSSNQINAIDEKFVDDTGVVFMQMDGNVCSNELMVSDRTDPLKLTMRRTLKKCFDNFKLLQPACPVDNLGQRVCQLEENKAQVDEQFEYLNRQIADLKDENLKMQPIIYEMQKYLERQKTLEEQFKAIVAAVERLLKQVFN